MQSPSNPLSSGKGPETPATPWYSALFAKPGVTFACVAISIGAALAASYVLPPKYLARARIIMPNSSKASALAGLAGSLGVSADSGSLPMFAAILRSEAMLKRVSDRTGLETKRLRKLLVAKDDVKSNTIEITATGPGREKMLGVVQASIQSLAEIASRVNLPLKQDQSTRLQTVLLKRQKDLAEDEQALKAFMTTAKTLPGGTLGLSGAGVQGDSKDAVSDADSVAPGLGYRQRLSALEIQLRSIDSSVAAIRATSEAQQSTPPIDLPPVKLYAERMAEARTRLAEVRSRYREGSPEVVEAEKALTAVQGEMRTEVDRYLKDVRSSLTGPAQTLAVTRAGIESQIAEVKKYVDAAPQEAITYLRLFRNVAQSEAVVNQIRLMYEKARVEQTNDPNTWAVLDAPALDEEFDPHQLTRNLSFGGLLGLIVAYAIGQRYEARSRS